MAISWPRIFVRSARRLSATKTEVGGGQGGGDGFKKIRRYEELCSASLSWFEGRSVLIGDEGLVIDRNEFRSF